ncbi:MAG: cbb3-type cytochrome c oxidase N-terminal domain-containing protein [Pseudobdellovibrionaceae bacterium]
MSNSDNKEQDIILSDREYDGIQEYDNPLPNWWLVTFFGTIIFAFVYWIHYSFGGGWSQSQELAHDLKQIEKSVQIVKPVSEVLSEAKLEEFFNSEERKVAGKSIYEGKCASCHGPNGEGLIGPNLTDLYFIHGTDRSSVMTVVNRGVLEKGMPAWEQMMKSDEVIAVSAFVYSLRGKNLPGKEPQGAKLK